MSEPFLFSVPEGEAVEVEPFHTLIAGQTQFSGKTTLAKRMATWAEEQGYRILVYDTKETEADYQGFGREVPVCLRQPTDSFVLIGLLESMFRRKLTPYYATLSRLSQGAADTGEIITRAKKLESETRSAWLKDASRVLYDLLERLQAETQKIRTVPSLELNEGINRMVINELSLEAQQLVVKNSFEDLLRSYARNTICILDEAFKFLPQGFSSAATRPIMLTITQGAKTGLFVWIATQFLAITDKDPLKACALKFLGTQDHETEVVHTLNLVPEAKARFTKDDIMKMKLGHWILVRKSPPYTGIVYALPIGVETAIGRKVARNELSPQDIKKRLVKEDEDIMYKERYETVLREKTNLGKSVEALIARAEKAESSLSNLTTKYKSLEGKHQKIISLLSDMKEQIGHFEHFRDALVGVLEPFFIRLLKEDMGRRLQNMNEELTKVTTIVGDHLKGHTELEIVRPEFDQFRKELEGIKQELQKSLTDDMKLHSTAATLLEEMKSQRNLLADHIKACQVESGEDLLLLKRDLAEVKTRIEGLSKAPPSEISVQNQVPRLTISVERPPLRLSSKDIQGRVAMLYGEGFFDREERTVSEVQNQMVQRWGAAKDPRLSGFMDEMCSWGYLTRRRTDRWLYKAALTSEQAREGNLLIIEEVRM